MIIVDDTIFIHWEMTCENWNRYLSYQHILKGMQSSSFKWVKCNADILPLLYIQIGIPSPVPFRGAGHIEPEEQLLLTEKELRSMVNALYENVQSQKPHKIYDIMLLREMRGQLFWNWLFYFMKYE